MPPLCPAPPRTVVLLKTVVVREEEYLQSGKLGELPQRTEVRVERIAYDGGSPRVRALVTREAGEEHVPGTKIVDYFPALRGWVSLRRDTGDLCGTLCPLRGLQAPVRGSDALAGDTAGHGGAAWRQGEDALVGPQRTVDYPHAAVVAERSIGLG